MIATLWTNGNTELGLKISAKDRDQFFKKEWAYVILEVEGLPYPIDVEGNCVNSPRNLLWTSRGIERTKRPIVRPLVACLHPNRLLKNNHWSQEVIAIACSASESILTLHR